MKQYVSINTFVMKIYKHSKQVFKGTKYENDWYFYHDALSFMTCKQCQYFMIKQDIYKHWILPLHNINAGTVYAGRPVGNTPEIMPLDSNLNKDIHEAVKTHSTYTNILDQKDPKKLVSQQQSTDKVLTVEYGIHHLALMEGFQVVNALCRMLIESLMKLL